MINKVKIQLSGIRFNSGLITAFLCWILFFSQILSQPLATGHDKFLGNTINWSAPDRNWDSYWNQVTPENGGKWGVAEPLRDNYDWSSIDRAYNYARNRSIPFRLHVLVWSQQYPNWIGSLTAEEVYEEIEEYIKLCSERYPDADYVEALNEPLHFINSGWPNGSLIRDALGGTGTTGWDFVIKAFELARKYFPSAAKLYLNEYSVIGDNTSTTRYLEIINLLKDRGLIDGIAFQGHRFELSWASVTTMKYNLDRLAATGLPIQVTEFDCGTDNNSAANEEYTLSEYQRIFPVLWEHPGVEGITCWGYMQGTMWQRNCYLVRSDGSETPAMEWLREYLSNPVDVNEQDDLLPVEFQLQQNYPNPFNPTTVISYYLPIADDVKLSIYNLLGQEVKSLVNSYQGAGQHSILWDGTNEINIQVCSGVYFYRLETSSVNINKKMILLK